MYLVTIKYIRICFEVDVGTNMATSVQNSRFSIMMRPMVMDTMAQLFGERLSQNFGSNHQH